MSGGGGSSGSNTTVQQQQIPAYEQAFSQSNQDLSQSLASQPYPQYGGALIQPMNDTQTQGEYQALNAANSYQPGLYAAGSTYGNAAGLQGNVLGSISNAQTATGQGQISSATEDALSQQQQASGAAQALASNPNAVQSY